MRKVVRRALIALALAATSVAAGCDRENDGAGERRTVIDSGATSTPEQAPTSETPPSETPASAYASWLSALARQDAAAACDLQAPELTIELRYEAILVDRAELGDPCVGFEALLWEDPQFESEIIDIATTQETEEDALLAVQLGQGTDTQDLTVRMVYHRAHWRVFSTTDRTDDDALAAQRWVAAWCQLTPDLSRAEITALMGTPSGEYTVADGGEPQLWWALDQYDFRVYLDPVDDSVLELVGDYDTLDAADRAQLTCPELRS